MNSVIHINDKLTQSGGVEVYLSRLQPLLRANGWNSDWISIARKRAQVQVDSSNTGLIWTGPISELRQSPIGKRAAETGSLFHIHSLSDPKLLDQLLKLTSCVRTAHEPRMTCPGQGRFFTRTERVCELKAGAHCLLHAYTERCCNRHPKRLIKAMANAHFERSNAAKRYAQIISNSSYTTETLYEAGFPDNAISRIHYFCSLPERISAPSHCNSKEILFVGRLSLSKGVHHLLRAHHAVLETVPDAKLTLIGDGIDRRKLEELTSKLGLLESVEFEGWRDNSYIGQKLEKSAVVAFPSLYPEAFGIVGLEAMSYGKPVVGYNVGGVSDWLKHQETGLLVPPGDINGLAKALTEVLNDIELAQELGKNGRHAVETKFSPESHLQSLLEVYQNAQNSATPNHACN